MAYDPKADDSPLGRIARLQFPVGPHVGVRPRLDTPAVGYPKWHIPFGETVASLRFDAAGVAATEETNVGQS
jgi:hypothetical protein